MVDVMKLRILIMEKFILEKTLDLFARINHHISDLYANKHHCKDLQEAFNKYHHFSYFKFTPLYLYYMKSKKKIKKLKNIILYILNVLIV